MAKDANKNIVPWNPSGHLWLDGSLESDLPMKRIAELFGVNHYCVAQANPHIIPFLNSSENPSNFLTRSIKLIGTEVRAELQHRFSQVCRLEILT
jgi:predicted acylesterase/phospholipase RssA